MTHIVPSILPIPVTIPALGAASSYSPFAASALSSRKALPGSTSRSIRSRTGSLPRARWRSMARSSPPAPRSLTAAVRARRSATSSSSAALLAVASALAGSRRLRRTDMAGSVRAAPDGSGASAPAQRQDRQADADRQHDGPDRQVAIDPGHGAALAGYAVEGVAAQ